MEDDKAARISITLPRQTLKDFEKSMREIGIRKRSTAVRKAMEAFVRENRALSGNVRTRNVGTISYVYRHDKRELLDRLLDIQHDFGNIIVSTLHVHLDAERCFETLIVRGKTREIKTFIDRLLGLELSNISHQFI
ncbi:MAG: nickel-responsive transcriptional regulator NikR [Nitrososphaeria archaeon]